MRSFYLADDEYPLDFFSGGLDLIQTAPELMDPGPDDILFDLRDEAWEMELYDRFENLVFVNGVVGTLRDHAASDHIIRFNGWPGMLTRPLIEAAASESMKERASVIFQSIGKGVEWVADVPGLVSPRVIAMIINEACFAENEKVSDRKSIDTALKLGTNYPKGPFEWAAQIGWNKISRLINVLSITGDRYYPADQLKTTS